MGERSGRPAGGTPLGSLCLQSLRVSNLFRCAGIRSSAAGHSTCMHRHGPAYLLPGEDVSGQFNHSEVAASQRLVQVVQAGDLPVAVALGPRHGCGRRRGGATFCCSPLRGQFFISSSRVWGGQASFVVDSRTGLLTELTERCPPAIASSAGLRVKRERVAG